MMVSPFTPLFFIDRKTDGVACEYVQTFATTDQILIELIGENDWGGGARVIDGFTEEPLFEITLNIRVINEETTLRFATLSLSPGVYSVEIDGIGKSQSVKITDNVKELAKQHLYSIRCITTGSGKMLSFLSTICNTFSILGYREDSRRVIGRSVSRMNSSLQTRLMLCNCMHWNQRNISLLLEHRKVVLYGLRRC